MNSEFQNLLNKLKEKPSENPEYTIRHRYDPTTIEDISFRLLEILSHDYDFVLPKAKSDKKYSIHVVTDWDFGIDFNGEQYTESEFDIHFDSLSDLDYMMVIGPFGAPKTTATKYDEFEEAIKRIKENPDESFDTTRGDRGVRWK